ncbi:unnamed protein product [Effrenium voratum]|nr:unnamed protein product [Effrenium voratum]
MRLHRWWGFYVPRPERPERRWALARPMTEWRLAELSASVKGLQEQLELQARRGDACDARLQRHTVAFPEWKVWHCKRPCSPAYVKKAPKVGADLLDDVAVAACNAFGEVLRFASRSATHETVNTGAIDENRPMGHELADVVEGLRHQLALEASKAMESVQDLEVRLATAEAANGASRAQAQRHAEQLEQLAASAERVCSQDRADGARAEASARLEPRRPDQVEAGLAELRSVLAEDLADLRARIAAETSARLGESRRLEQAEAGLAELRSAAEVETALAELQRQVAEQTSAKDLWREREEIRNLKNRMTQAEDRAQHSAKQLSQLEGRLVQVAEVSPEPVQQLAASVDELRSKMDIAALQERLATAEEAVEAAAGRLAQVTEVSPETLRQLTEVSPEPVQQLAASVDELRSKMASTPWTQDIAALQERLATAEEAVEAATEATKSASQDQAQKAEQLSQLEGRLVQVEEVSPEPVQQLTASVDELRSKMASTPWTQAQKAEQLSQLEGRLVQVEEVSPEPVQQLTASVDELRSKMASTPWTQDLAALQERLATAEEAVEAATEAAKSASQDQAQKAEQLSQLEGRLVQVEEVSPEPVQQLIASVDELRSKMASTPWTQDIAALQKRLATAEEAVGAATEAAKSASQDQAQKAEQLSQLERRLAQVAELSPEPVQQVTASVEELRARLELFEAQVQRFRGAEVLQRVEELRRQVERMEGTPDLQAMDGELKEELDAGHRRQERTSRCCGVAALLAEQRAEAREVEAGATNQQLDAAVQKQDRLAADRVHITKPWGSQAWLEWREHRLEAAALWQAMGLQTRETALGELAEHIGAEGGKFIQAEGGSVSSSAWEKGRCPQ